MNYQGCTKWSKEEDALDYMIGCKYIVEADIATCYPSMYSHSVPWALLGKEKAKANFNHNCQKCPSCSDSWPNGLDKILRQLKDDETNGILIGPHTSNIISEIILTQIDCALQDKKFTKVIRHIDDYRFYAEDERKAKEFVRQLDIELKKFELSLNSKKTKIIPFSQYDQYDWTSKLNQFRFPDNNQIGYTTIDAYINLAMGISREISNFAVLNYAIKVIYTKKLSDRAKRMYIKKIFQIAIEVPYLIPLLENYVFCFAGDDFDFLGDYLPVLLKISLDNGATDAISYIFYYAIKYKIHLFIEKIYDDNKSCVKSIIDLNDCVSMLLTFCYYEGHEDKELGKMIKDHAAAISKSKTQESVINSGCFCMNWEKLTNQTLF